jgi:hypothetical protein
MRKHFTLNHGVILKHFVPNGDIPWGRALPPLICGTPWVMLTEEAKEKHDG